MSTLRKPRDGSRQFRPRVRAKKQHARVRSWANEKGVLGFAGFKAGMTQIVVTDNRKNSMTKGRDITMPVTMVECPPVKIAGIRFYQTSKERYGEQAATEVRFKADKHAVRTTTWKETGKLESINPEEYTRAVLLIHTQPSLTGIGQKKPHILEVQFGGSVQEAIDFVKETKELSVEDVLQAGEFVDSHSVTTGKGTQGPVKRMGIGLKSHKSQKGRRKGVLGPEGYKRVSNTAPQSGQLGYHLRTEYNKQIMGIVPAEQAQMKGGILRFGQPKNTVVLVKGSLGGPKKRLITLTKATRPDPKASTQAMEVQFIANRSHQGNI